MGVKRLKVKDELHYRKGYTHASCSQCNSYVGRFPIVDGRGEVVAHEPRCRVIGLGGRQFRINPEYICDRYDNSEEMKQYQQVIEACKRRHRTNANFRQPHR